MRGTLGPDAACQSVGEALSAIGYAGDGVFPPPQAYVELHVECGSVLERAGERLAAITRH